MDTQVEPGLQRDARIHKPAQHGEHRQRRDPCGLLESHAADCRRMLELAEARFHYGI
jgi:hypothetical protein